MGNLHCSPVLCLFACSCSCGGIYITCHILIFFGVLLFKLHQIYVCVSFLPPFGFIECQHVIGGRTVCLRLTWNNLLSQGRDKLCPQQQSHPLAKQWHTITECHTMSQSQSHNVTVTVTQCHNHIVSHNVTVTQCHSHSNTVTQCHTI